MSTASMRSGTFASAEDDVSPTRKAIRWLLILFAVGLLLFLVAWLLGYVRLTTDPRIVEIQKLQADAQKTFMADGGPQTLEDAKAAVTSMNQIREKIDALPEGLRREAGRRSGSVFRSAMQNRISTYFSLPPDQRQAELDRQIKQDDLFRKAWEGSRPAGGQGGAAGAVAVAGGGQAGGGQAGGGQTGTAGGPGSGGTASGGGGGPGGGSRGPGSGGPPRNGNEEDRNRWRKNIIDSTTPEQRAKYVEYRRAMEARREQLGMPSPWSR